MGTEPRRSTRGAELLGFLSFGLALMLLISLATFNPHDPALFFRAGATGPARNFIGPAGAFLAELLVPQLFGVTALLLPLVLGLAGWKLFWCKPIEAPYTKGAGLLLMLLSLTAFATLTFGTVTFEAEPVRAGAAVGELLAALLTKDFNRTGAYIVVATTLFVILILSTQFSFATLLNEVGARTGGRFQSVRTAWANYRETRRKERMRREVIRKHTQKEAAEASESLPRVRKAKSSPGEAEEGDPRPLPTQRALPFVAEPAGEVELDARPQEPPPPKRRRAPVPEAKGDSSLPPLAILDEIQSGSNVDHERLYERGRILQAKCGEFGVLGTVKEIHPGPIVTTYEFKPDAGVKYSKIVTLADDLALALEPEAIGIDRVSAKGNVGIELPNDVRETISLREILESDSFRKAPGRLTLALGKTVGGDPYVTDLAGMPHLLIAGSTGTGKSVGLNCMISSILYKSTPDEVRLILIDPKRLELGVYEDIPHLLTPVVTDAKVASNVLKWAVAELEKPIRKLASDGVRNIEQFNNIIRAEPSTAEGEEELRPLHYIVVVIDELADLMIVSSHEVEERITRLPQMARAVGIHLILATQRPSVDVLTGLIKANFPSRLSYRLAARVDSRTILDSIGAEHLLEREASPFPPPATPAPTPTPGAS